MKKYSGFAITIILIILFSINVIGTQYTICSGGCDFADIDTGLESVTGTNNTLTITESGNYAVTNLTTFYINDASNNGGIYINEEDVAIDFNDINIIGTGTGYGIYIVNNNITISNCNIINYSVGLYFESTSNSYLINNTISSSTWGIRLSETNDTTIKYNTISNISATALQLINAAVNNTFWNSQITTSTLDIDSSGNETTNTILNSSFNETSLNFYASAELYIKWFFNTHLNDTTSNNIIGATINITDITSNLLYSLSTDGLGFTPTQIITEYLVNTSGYSYYSDFNFYAYNNTNYINSSINISESKTVSLTFDLNPPTIAISNPANNTNLSNSTTSTNVSITTDELSDCSYNLSNSGFDYINEGTPMTSSADGLSHWFNYIELTSNTTYNIYYKCNDSLGNINPTTTHHTFHVNQTPPDTTPPTITISTPTNDSYLSNSTTWVNVSITTNEQAKCSYNLTDPITLEIYENLPMTSSDNNLTHWFNYSELSQNTTYIISYNCSDSLGNINPSSTHHIFYINKTPLETIPPVITILNPTNNTYLSNSTTSVNISITTNEQAVCHYNINNAAFDYATQGTVMSDSNDNQSHWFTYSSLISNTSYNIYYKCNDTLGNINTNSLYHIFHINETLDTLPPTISNLLNISTDALVIISFNTNKKSNLTIKYGTSQSALNTAVNNESFESSFSVSINSLSSSTTYYYNITLCSELGFCTEYGPYSFTTTAILDITPPTISNIINSTITNNSATITWTTNEAANRIVKYGTTTGTYTLSENGATYLTSHSITLSGFSPTTTYYYVVNSSDASGNSVQSSENSFTTIDLTPPTLSNIISSSVTGSTATITWTSSEAANSQVIYGTTNNIYLYSASEMDFVTSHNIDLTNLDDGTTYYYKVISNDSFTNSKLSPEYSFTTIDTSAPVITFSYPINMSTTITNSPNMRLTITTNEAATCYVNNHKIGTSEITTDITLTPANSNNISHTGYFDATTESNDYNFYYTVVCTDANSNSGSSRVYFALDDTVAPTATFSSTTPSDNSYSNQVSETIQITPNEHMASTYPKISFNDATNVSMTSSGDLYSYTKSSLTDGEYNFSVFLLDIGSNLNSYSRTFIVDTQEPEIDEFYPEDNQELRNCMGLIMNITLDEEGECSYELYIFEEEDYDECNDDCSEDKSDCDDDDDKTSSECNNEFDDCEEDCEKEKYNLEDEDIMEESEHLEDCQDACEETQDTCEDTCEDEDNRCNNLADDSDDRDDCDDDFDDCEEDCQEDKNDCDEECEESYIFEADFSNDCLDDAEYLTVFTCEDLAGNEIEENITFTVNDINAPKILSSYPSGEITQTSVKLSITTDENAICKYSTEKISYSQMEESFGSSSTVHSESLENLENQDYVYYVLCNDTRGNLMTSHEEISFWVNSSSATTSDSQSFSDIKSGETVTFDIKKTDISIIKIEVDVNSDLNFATIDIKKIVEFSNIKTYSETVYQYLQISKEGISNKQIDSVTIDFKIPNSWISSGKIDADNIKLFKYTTNWEEVPTTKISQDSKYAYFQSTTTGFSLFAVSTKKQQVTSSVTSQDTTPNVEDTDDQQTTPLSEEKMPDTEEPIEILDDENTSYFWLIILLCVMVVGGGTAGFFVYKSHRHPQQNSYAESHIQPTQTVAKDEQSTSETAHPDATPQIEYPDDELAQYIYDSIQNNQSIKEISKTLVGTGYTQEDINFKLTQMGIIDELRDYINEALKSGQNLKEIKQMLINSGYGPQDIINKFVDMNLNEDENQGSNEEVTNYIVEALKSGMDIINIKKTLIDAGHDESDLNNIISNINPEEINQEEVTNNQDLNKSIHNEENNKQIINYIQDSLEYDMSENQIIQQLVEEGHDINHIQALMNHVLHTMKPKEHEVSKHQNLKPSITKSNIKSKPKEKLKNEPNLKPHEIIKKHSHKHDEIMNYIKKALDDKIPKRLIKSELIKSGHTKKEINKRFIEIAAVEKKLRKDLKIYIKAEKKAGIKKTQIKNELLDAGIDKKLLKKLI